MTNTGTINIDTEGGYRALGAELINSGTVNVNYSGSLGRAGAHHVNTGDINIAAGKTLTITGADETFTQSDGTLQIDGGLSINQGTFTLDSGAIAGPGGLGLSLGTFNFNGGSSTLPVIGLSDSTLNIGAGSKGAGVFQFFGSDNHLSGDVAAAQTLQLPAYTGGGGSHVDTIVTATAGFTNAGVISLSAFGPRDFPSTAALNVTSGTLTNTGTINLDPDGGFRSFGAELNNSGTLNVNYSASLGRADAHHVNTGAINVAAGKTLAIVGANPTFTQSEGTLQIDGGLSINQGTFTLGGGTVAGTGGFGLSLGTFNFNGGSSTLPVIGLSNSTLNIGAGSKGAGVFQFFGSDNHLSGDVAATQTLQLPAYTGGGGSHVDTIVTAAAGFTNAGIISLSAFGPRDYPSTAALNVTSGTLTNVGTINLDASGGYRSLGTELNNSGTVNVYDRDCYLGRIGARHVNSGDINIVPGARLFIIGDWWEQHQDATIGGGGSFIPGSAAYYYTDILNPSFELGSFANLGDPNYADFGGGVTGTLIRPGQTNLANWNVALSPYDSDHVLSFHPQLGFGLEWANDSAGTLDGYRLVDLNRGGDLWQISQTLATIPGQRYEFSYYALGGGQFGGATTEIKLVGGGNLLTADDVTSTQGSQWERFTHTFVADGASTTLFLTGKAVGRDGSTGALIDKLSLVEVPNISVSVDDVTVTEGTNPDFDFHFTNALVTFRLSEPSNQAVRVNYRTADNTATASSDYGFAFGTAIFLRGETEQSVVFTVRGDNLAEDTERFVVNVVSVENATIAKGQAVVTILDDDRPTSSPAFRYGTASWQPEITANAH